MLINLMSGKKELISLLDDKGTGSIHEQIFQFWLIHERKKAPMPRVH